MCVYERETPSPNQHPARPAHVYARDVTRRDPTRDGARDPERRVVR